MKLHVLKGNDCTLYCFYCPGCRREHPFTVRSDGKHPAWTFDGNLESPTFSPSLRVLDGWGGTECHLFLRAGKIEYCADSRHEFAGKTIDLPDWKPYEEYNPNED